MPASAKRQHMVGRKVSKACERCRMMKVKCSGLQPCSRCDRKKERCNFAAGSKRISVSESYLRQLERRNNQILPSDQRASSEGLLQSGREGVHVFSPIGSSRALDALAEAATPDANPEDDATVAASSDQSPCHLPSTGNTRPHQGVGETDEAFIGNAFQQNPLADNDHTFTKIGGRFWYMGPCSSWSFCRRVLALLGYRFPEASWNPDPGHFNSSVFRLCWIPLGSDQVLDVANVPPLDYALLLFNMAKFYLGPIFYIIDEQNFLRQTHDFYDNPAVKALSSRHWYAQYLLIMAFGKALSSNKSSRNEPAGYQYAARGMALMPDLAGLAADPIQAVQALALGAVYLQSVDMRVGASHHIGHALRICIIEGWHRHMPEQIVGLEHSRRCNIIFWIVYRLEREFGPLIGAPCSICDGDITAKLPSEMDESPDALNMALHVRLSRLMARILTAVYGVGEEYNGSLVANTQEVLRELAQLSKDINTLLNNHFQGSISKASRMALRLILSYHHCVVLTTRPLVMCALHMHIKHAEIRRSGPISLSPPVASLLQSCVDSALTILRTLRVMGDEDLLEAFLPFQLEDAFSSAFILYLIRAISPSLLRDDNWPENVRFIMDNMISKGSVVAPLRKLELGQLEQAMRSLRPQGGDEPLTPSLSTYDPREHQDSTPATPSLTVNESGWDLFLMNGMVGISPGEMLDLAAQLEVENTFAAPVGW